eukprot:scpid70128/ scgid34392/ 
MPWHRKVTIFINLQPTCSMQVPTPWAKSPGKKVSTGLLYVCLLTLESSSSWHYSSYAVNYIAPDCTPLVSDSANAITATHPLHGFTAGESGAPEGEMQRDADFACAYHNQLGTSEQQLMQCNTVEQWKRSAVQTAVHRVQWSTVEYSGYTLVE